MCFSKETPRKVAKQDMYVIKAGRAHEENFLSGIRAFNYSKGKLYKKGLKEWFLSMFRYELNSEVFHCYTVDGSKKMLSVNRSNPRCWDILRCYRDALGDFTYHHGIFLIPKGTTYYENKEDKEVATFNIMYLCPLTEETQKIIFEQKPLHEIIQMDERETKNM